MRCRTRRERRETCPGPDRAPDTPGAEPACRSTADWSSGETPPRWPVPRLPQSGCARRPGTPRPPPARDGAVVFRGWPQPDSNAPRRSGRSGPRCGRGVPGGPGQAGDTGQCRTCRAADARRHRPWPVMGWTALLTAARPLFRAPSFALFTDLLTGWVLAPGRRTITAMIAVADPACGRAHDAYHRFVRDGACSMSGLWRLLAIHAVATFAPSGVVSLDCDDTLFHKSGRRVAGAGTFRDAVRSTSHRVVYALGLNLVVVTLRVIPPWGDMPIAVPVNARLHKKKDPTTTVEHAAPMRSRRRLTAPPTGPRSFGPTPPTPAWPAPTWQART